jgi:hypothetical protein
LTALLAANCALFPRHLILLLTPNQPRSDKEGKALFKHLLGVRHDENNGREGTKSKAFRLMVRGMLNEWHGMVEGQAEKAQRAYDEIDKATKRLDQRAIIQILTKKLKYPTSSWVRTQVAGLLALGATSKVGDEYATQIGVRYEFSSVASVRFDRLGLFLWPGFGSASKFLDDFLQRFASVSELSLLCHVEAVCQVCFKCKQSLVADWRERLTLNSLGRMLGSVEWPLREAACKLFGMIHDPSDREVMEKIYKRASRRERPEVRTAAKKAVQDIMYRGSTVVRRK